MGFTPKDWVSETDHAGPPASPPGTPISGASLEDLEIRVTDYADLQGGPIFNVKHYGGVGNGVAEPADPFQDAYDAAVADGGGIVYVPAGNFLVSDAGSSAVWTLARDNAGTAGKVMILLSPAAMITLSANTPRLIDLGRVADYDLFHDFELNGQGATINANDIGGEHHVVIGTWVSGAEQNRLNISDFTIQNLKVTNALNDPTETNHRLHIWFMPINNAGTETTIEGIVCRNIQMEGGNAGIGVGATATTSAETYINDVLIENCSWNPGAVPAAGYAATGFHVGGAGRGGACRLINCWAVNSGDNGFEIDSMSGAILEGCWGEDNWNGTFYFLNQRQAAVGNYGHQQYICRNCTAAKTDAMDGLAGAGLGFVYANEVGDPDMGTLILEGCRYEKSCADWTTGGQAIDAHGGGWHRITIRDFVHRDTAVSVSTGTTYPGVIWLGSTLAGAFVEIDGLDVVVTGNRPGTGAPWFRVISLEGADMIFSIKDVAVSFDVTNLNDGHCHVINVGSTTGATLQGTIRGVTVRTMTGDAAGFYPIWIRGTATVTIPSRVLIADCDFHALNGVTGQDVWWVDSNQNMEKTILQNNRWRTPVTAQHNVPSAATISVPQTDYVQVYNSGAGTIDNITGMWPGAMVNLKFADGVTMGMGGNLKLAGTFSAGADDTMSLVCNGGTWFEAGRSANS